MPHHGVTARPVDYFDTVMPGIWLVTDARQSPRRDVLGLFNWESSDQSIACSAAKAGLDPTKTYHAFDFWSNAPLPPFCGQLKADVPAESCRVIAVRLQAEHPVIVSTSRHVTQGIVDLTGEKWSGALKTLTGTSQLIANDPYQLRVAGLQNGRHRWKLASATVRTADAAAGVTLAPEPSQVNEPGWLRVNLRSSTTQVVHWTLNFAKE